MRKITTRPVSGTATSLTLCIAAAIWTTSADAASFDCKRAATPVEQAICADSALGDVDSQLAEIYKDTQVALPDAQASEIARIIVLTWANERLGFPGDAGGE
ncbi:lysozyme inhibitor LprI family protein [Paraburkholderia megapolitana]|uniref:Lysozyme inhibitor LprI N-terminal domain-containing protein n=1 Tax=Paraburkholderia megapolitana TaxID=420953 RepID=A0A1I3DDE5_9BURK|nr:hypothetical protein [Paraburkholderia megapolitana]QDQ81790.1 hypothetical protein FNZ07_11850 [Paraburkholderia megapolitana]SFH84703.1 hypothetical protein SAMN05192543_101243 [Paraburkholderia megapolitana]